MLKWSHLSHGKKPLNIENSHTEAQLHWWTIVSANIPSLRRGIWPGKNTTRVGALRSRDRYEEENISPFGDLKTHYTYCSAEEPLKFCMRWLLEKWLAAATTRSLGSVTTERQKVWHQVRHLNRTTHWANHNQPPVKYTINWAKIELNKKCWLGGTGHFTGPFLTTNRKNFTVHSRPKIGGTTLHY